MKHIILFLFIISFTVGISTILLMSVHYFKTKKSFIKYAIQCDLCFTGLLLVDIVTYYTDINLINESSLFYMFILMVLLLTAIGMTYYLFKAVFSALELEFPPYWSLTFWFIAALFIVGLLSLNILYATHTLANYFEYPSSFMLHNGFSAIGSFINIYLVFKYRNKLRVEIRKVSLIGIIFLSIIIPASVIVNGMEFWIDFGMPMPFSPIIYFSCNIIALFITIREFDTKQELTEVPLEVMLMDYLSSFDITDREVEIISCVVKGLSNGEIGEQLFISPNTVKNHIYNIYKKMDVKNRYELMSQLNQFAKK